MKRYVRRGNVIKADAINRAVDGAVNQVVSLNPGVSRIGDHAVLRPSSILQSAINAGTRINLGGGAFEVEEVNILPPLPEKGYKRVYWRTPEQGGTGDGQMWEAYAGYERWAPCNFLTSKDGVPGE